MKVSGGPNMLDMLSLLGGVQAGQGTGAGLPGPGALAALAPLLRDLSGGRGGPDIGSLAALAPLLQSLSAPAAGRAGPGKAAAGDSAAPPVIDLEPRPAAEQTPYAPAQDARAQDASAQDGPAQDGPAQDESAQDESAQEPGGSRGGRQGRRGFSLDPALLGLLTSLGGAARPRPDGGPPPPQSPAGEQPPPSPGPEPQQETAEEFDPCAGCPLDCPRRNPSLSFGQVQALAATFPAYI